MPIPDNTTVDSTLTVSGLAQPITNVSVSFYLTHTFDADLTISLIGPDGDDCQSERRERRQREQLRQRVFNALRDDVRRRRGELHHARVGAVRRLVPSRAAALDVQRQVGPGANGTWKLRITDSFAGDTGTLLCWSLNINQGAIPGVAGDFDGNGSADLTVFRPGTGQWFINGVSSSTFGSPGDMPVPGDYDGNGITEAAVYRPSTGQWFLSGPGTVVQYGRTGDIPVPADYDGDKKTDSPSIARPRAAAAASGISIYRARRPSPWASAATSRCRATTTATAARISPSIGPRPASGSSRPPPAASRPSRPLVGCPRRHPRARRHR